MALFLRGRVLWFAISSLVIVVPTGIFSQASGSAKPPANGESFGAATFALQAKVNSLRYSEGLKIAEEGLARFPNNPDLEYGSALCLIGLFRNREAAERLMPLAQSHPERPDFTFTLGEAQFHAGDGQSAMKTWASLFSDPVMAEKAYSLSVKTLLASGREEEARRLADEGLARLPRPSEELIKYKLDLVLRASEGLPLLDKLIALDPQNANAYEALRLLYQTGGDKEFYEIESPSAKTAEIPLSRTSSPRQSTAMELNMGTGGITTASSFPNPVLTAKASINGAPLEPMILDSGSPLVFLSPQLVVRLGLKPVSAVNYVGLGDAGVVESSWALLDSLQVGPVVFHNVPAVILNPRTTDWGGRFAGIIPVSLFKHQAILYDPSGPSLKIMASGTSPEKVLGAGGFEVKTAWFKGCPFARTSIQDLTGLFCLLDTGSFTTFLTPDVVPGLYTRADSLEWRSSSRKSGLSGGFDAMVARQIRLCIGERCTILSIVQVAPIPLPYSIPCAGIIGRNILDQYVVFLDYGANRAFFKRRER